MLPRLPTKEVIIGPLASPRYLKSNVAVPRRSIDATPYENPVGLPFVDVCRPESIIMPVAIIPMINIIQGKDIIIIARKKTKYTKFEIIQDELISLFSTSGLSC